jgi:diguanylate cyclase (GGDEF)-like protein
MSLALKKASQTFKFDRAYFINSEENKSPLVFKIETLVENEKTIEGSDIDSPVLETLADPLQRNIQNPKPIAILKGGSQFVLISIQGKNTALGYLVFERSLAEEMNSADLDLMQVMAQHLTMTLDNEMLYYKSITDEKTKLYNARYFSTTMRKEVHRSLRTRSPFGLMVIDIDHFKKFNDSYGHQMGDLVLKHVAMQIKAAIRASDIPSRFGGEEFAVMMVDSPIEGVMMAAERVRQSIESIGVPTEEFGVLKVTASVGVAICPDHAGSEKDLFEAADKALYHAKKSGRNNVQLFDETKMQSIS